MSFEELYKLPVKRFMWLFIELSKIREKTSNSFSTGASTEGD
jgi:hypothetical protein